MTVIKSSSLSKTCSVIRQSSPRLFRFTIVRSGIFHYQNSFLLNTIQLHVSHSGPQRLRRKIREKKNSRNRTPIKVHDPSPERRGFTLLSFGLSSSHLSLARRARVAIIFTGCESVNVETNENVNTNLCQSKMMSFVKTMFESSRRSVFCIAIFPPLSAIQRSCMNGKAILKYR